MDKFNYYRRPIDFFNYHWLLSGYLSVKIGTFWIFHLIGLLRSPKVDTKVREVNFPPAPFLFLWSVNIMEAPDIQQQNDNNNQNNN